MADILIIGAGPSGSLAGLLLARRGHRVRIVERQRFPRFSIGESLLAQSTQLLADAGLLEAVVGAGFQFKNGAAFVWGERRSEFNFAQKSSAGPGFTFQVQREQFDLLLADCAREAGVEIEFEVEVTAASFAADGPRVEVSDGNGRRELRPDWVLDASGFGRVLPRLLDLELPSSLAPRRSVFTHFVDRIPAGAFDRQKVCIAIHPEQRDIWYWLIPFANGRCSLGVVLPQAFPDHGASLDAQLRARIAEEVNLSALLGNADICAPVRQIHGYSAKAKALHGPGWALLGNAAEFLDPVFSSGVTIALKSATLAADVLDRQFKGEAVDWTRDFAEVLNYGVETFRHFVEAWYDGALQDVIFYHDKQPAVRRMICSILAGYAWDTANPYTGEQGGKRLRTLARLCRANTVAA